MLEIVESVKILPELKEEYKKVLTPEAMLFVADLHRKFNGTRKGLLSNRRKIQEDIDSGIMPNFLEKTKAIREDSSWIVADTPSDLQDRRVEITGPVERKMMINALNSGANVFMADFEDSNSPTWDNTISGQINLSDAINKTISFSNPDGKEYKLNEKTATLLVRPRGWHLVEKNILVDEEEMSASIFDFGLYFFHNVKNLLEKRTGPYFYLPKMENHQEARLWNDIFVSAQKALNIPVGTIKVTVLLETILASFEIEEILYELRDHIVGINAGRWDYIFSIIKKFRNQKDFCLPDRSQITMNVPFMKAYCDILVKTCHKRNAHAIGGMSAFIPSRKDAKVNEIAMANVKEDKLREVNAGFDGTWVAHPDLVSVAKEIFDQKLGDNPNQKDELREDVIVESKQLIDFNLDNSKVTENGVRNNINVTIQYMASWLSGIGAVAIHNLMEDAATAEISRSQLWQWLHNGNVLLDGEQKFTQDLFNKLLLDEAEKIKSQVGEDSYTKYRYNDAVELLDNWVVNTNFEEFITLRAYRMI